MKHHTKLIQVFSNLGLLTFFLLISMSCSFSRSESYSFRDENPYLVKKFNVSSGKLFVSTSGGSIKVQGGEGNEVKVEMYVSSNKFNKSKVEEVLRDDYEITIEQEGSTIKAIAKRTAKGWFNNGISISFEVQVPRQFECELLTSGGSLKLASVSGDRQILKTSGGSINMEDIEGDLEAHTSGGSIKASKILGNADIKTSGGSINISKLKGDLDADTSGGSINLNNIEGSVDAHTSGGGITANMDRLTSRLSLHTSGGSVNATVPSGMGLDLDLKGNRVNVSLQNFSGESKSDKVQGTVNGGGVPVQMSTSGGSVTLNFQ